MAESKKKSEVLTRQKKDVIMVNSAMALPGLLDGIHKSTHNLGVYYARAEAVKMIGWEQLKRMTPEQGEEEIMNIVDAIRGPQKQNSNE